jgi:hypothetical protein
VELHLVNQSLSAASHLLLTCALQQPENIPFIFKQLPTVVKGKAHPEESVRTSMWHIQNYNMDTIWHAAEFEDLLLPMTACA